MPLTRTVPPGTDRRPRASCCENANAWGLTTPGWRAAAERRSPTGIARERETGAGDAALCQREGRSTFQSRRAPPSAAPVTRGRAGFMTDEGVQADPIMGFPPGGGSTGDASRLNRPASRGSALRFGRNTPGPVLPVGAPPSRALSAGRLTASRRSRGFHHRLLTAEVSEFVPATAPRVRALPPSGCADPRAARLPPQYKSRSRHGSRCRMLRPGGSGRACRAVLLPSRP